MTNLLIRRCPECGDDANLYAIREARWDSSAKKWCATGENDDGEVECTNCLWMGLESEADPEADVDPDQWPGGDLTGHPGYAEQPLDTPSLDTSFHDREMDI